MEEEEWRKQQTISNHKFVPALRSQTGFSQVKDVIKSENKENISIKFGKELVIGFLGIEKYEVILYLSRILKQLHKKVLVLDCSEDGALDAGVCYFREQPVVYGELQEYRGIDYVNYTVHEYKNMEEYSVLQEKRKEYDFILIDFGFCRTHSLMTACHRYFFVSDQQRHNILRVKEAAKKCRVPFTVVLRDVLSCKVSLDYFTDFMEENQWAEEVQILYRNEADIREQIQCQYGQAVNFQKLSKDMKEFLKNMVKQLLPECTKAEIIKALKQAERGK